MNKALTEAQKLATHPEYSARVMANAGAGKTYVLTARVLRLLLQGTHPGKILCLTYTKAAAAEMRSRIDEWLKNWVLMDDAELKTSLATLLEAEPNAEQIRIAKQLFSKTLESSPPPRIQTIHSFCQDVLKRFPLESGVEPYFEVVEDVTARELIKETTQILLAKVGQAREVSDAIDYIASIAGETKFNDVISEVISQRNRVRDLFSNFRDTEELIAKIYSSNGLARNATEAQVFEEFWNFSEARMFELTRLFEALKSSKNENDNERGNILSQAVKQKNFGAYFDQFITKDNTPRKTIITQHGKKFFAEPDEVIGFEQAELLKVLESLTKIQNLEFTANVIYLAEGMLGTYESLKRSRAVIDYNDLIYYTKKLLTTGTNAAWVLYKLDGGIEHILIDEAQDTSPDQWRIILALLDEFMAGETAVERNRTIFIVGDEKQSIYSFQGADQRAFSEVAQYVKNKLNLAQKVYYEDIPIRRSFRSVEAVLKLVDAAFEPEILRQAVTSAKDISHELSRMGEGGKVEIWPVIKNEEKEALESWQLPLSYHSAKSADVMLAEKITENIKVWLDTGRILLSENRPVKPSDILILLRSRGELADILIHRLKKNKIPVSGSDRLRITEHIAVQDLLSLAKFLLLPEDDLNLACLLKSPLYGISEDDLFELCYQRGAESVWNRLRNNAKFGRFYENLKELLARVDYLSVYELFSKVLDEQGGRKKFISRLGAEVNDVIDEFLELSINFERSHTNSLQHFVSWVMLSDVEIKRDMEKPGSGETLGEVRIMTVHGSKGLEAPIVFLADAAKVPDGHKQQPLVWTDEHFYSYRSKQSLFANLREAVEEKETRDYEEYLRLLYVAVTRARDELYVCGSIGEKNRNIEKSWHNIIGNALAKIGVKDEASGIIKYETVHAKPLKQNPPKEVKVKTKLPDFLGRKLSNEKPEFIEIDELEFNELDLLEEISRGKKIHKVLEIIGNVVPAARDEYLSRVFSNQPEIIKNLKALLDNPEFTEVFADNALAEVPIIGRVDGEVAVGRIDRLIIKENEVVIIDFKTAVKIPAKMPESYIKQMDKYKAIIAERYPQHIVKAAVLWTSAQRLEYLA